MMKWLRTHWKKLLLITAAVIAVAAVLVLEVFSRGAAAIFNKAMMEQDMISTEPIRTEIMHYVSCLRPHVAKDKRDRYMQLWDRILGLPVVEKEIYDPGKQQDTNFNRNLVANIIHCLGSIPSNAIFIPSPHKKKASPSRSLHLTF